MPADEQKNDFNAILHWCSSRIGPCEIMTKDSRFHGRTSVLRLQTPTGFYYLKLHKQKPFWENEIHGYEQWAGAFGQCAPRLLAIHETEPLALLISELPGKSMDSIQLTTKQELEAWHSAGQALVHLHTHAQGSFLGPCTRDGSSAESPVGKAEDYIRAEFKGMLKKAAQEDLLNEQERSTLQAVQAFVPEFKGESPVPCHRDYGPANWLVNQDGKWTGVLDFEFSYWDVRVADFSRYPNWEWIHRPDLMEAFFDGYGRSLTAREENQCLLTRAQYALGAILWGCEHAFYGFEAEGRHALKHIRRLMG